MRYITDTYTVSYNDKIIGYYWIFDDGKVSFRSALERPFDLEEELKKLHLDKSIEDVESIKVLDEMIDDGNRVKGRRRIIYQNGLLRMERRPDKVIDRYSIYRRNAGIEDADHSSSSFEIPHYEGTRKVEGMSEWVSWYAFNRMDDDTYEAELDEAWYGGGGHNDGGTIHSEIPEEWFDLSYDEFLDKIIELSDAAKFGFTVEMLKEKQGLRKFFGY